ncbi:hypothetical protein DUNSADRAFT_16265 [Dunaliella salina]|uniref:R3H domain-containing protein n=1 Tax=Dunaliella salina TaxID=3046 RepID=A0ABQ7G3Y9_DUNSA|nr:hypothetical protein DUNSADRAFT_16265 [Dunaliella salina]|eukprot:KAF5829323.1 hypothetical protein DUNSADRAFT_16265 [Dunaliella salina]
MPAYIPPARRRHGIHEEPQMSEREQEPQVSEREQERIWRVKLLLPVSILEDNQIDACPQHLFDEGEDSSMGCKRYSFEIPSQASEWEWEDLLQWFAQSASECPEPVMVLPPSLSKGDRAMLHKMGERLG